MLLPPFMGLAPAVTRKPGGDLASISSVSSWWGCSSVSGCSPQPTSASALPPILEFLEGFYRFLQRLRQIEWEVTSVLFFTSRPCTARNCCLLSMVGNLEAANPTQYTTARCRVHRGILKRD